MPETWAKALADYKYRVQLSCYNQADGFPDHFVRTISGRRASTIEFEDYFRANYGNSVEPYFEVVFWKMFSQRNRRDATTDNIVNHVLQKGVTAPELRSAIDSFVEEPSAHRLSGLREGLGIKTRVLALALTFPAFVDPTRFPMVDMQTAKWVTANYSDHNRKRRNVLTPFNLQNTSLRYVDFDNYLNWLRWCREIAQVLTDKTNTEWRARDVEMAVFTAARQGLSLNPLP